MTNELSSMKDLITNLYDKKSIPFAQSEPEIEFELFKDIVLFVKPKPWKRAAVYAYKVGWVTVKSELGNEFKHIKQELMLYKQKKPIPDYIPVKIVLNLNFQSPVSLVDNGQPIQNLYGDIDNHCKCVLDMLQDGHIKILSNDCQVTELTAKKRFADENYYQIKIYVQKGYRHSESKEETVSNGEST